MVDPKNVEATSAKNTPVGWILLSKDFLDDFREELPREEAVAYFDGLSPSWKEALSSRIPQRAIVRDVQSSLEEAHRVKRRQVTLLMGAGGEGKSTALRQATANLTATYQNVLWHDDVNTPLGETFIKNLVASKESWLIASDEAEQICKEVFDAVRLLRERNKNNVQFLLCCRDTDWKGEHADEWGWREYVTKYEEKFIRGLTLEDANLVVEAWRHYGEEGLGKLAGLDPFQAASQLVEYARSEAQSYAAEGAFLGAMLRVRIGEAIKDHVKKLLGRLNKRKLPESNLTLMDAFAYIVALHAENILLLSRNVLGRSLGCPPEFLQSRVLGPLGEEAAASSHGVYVLGRHRAIAQTAKEIMSSVFGREFAEIYSKLLRSAREAYLEGALDVDVYYWNQLPQTLFDRGEKDLGIRLARVLIDVEPGNPIHVVRFSKLCREARKYDEAARAFEESSGRVKQDRAYYHELANLESSRRNFGLSVWMDAVSLSDGISEEKPDTTRTMRSLCGLSTSFRRLFNRAEARPFIEACAGAAHLGLQSSPDERTREALRHNKEESKKSNVAIEGSREALEKVIAGIVLAWEQRGESEEPLVPVKPASELTFQSLNKRFGIKGE